jgi:hypothetical protein
MTDWCYTSRLKNPSEPSVHLQRSKDKIDHYHSGFVFELVIRSSTMPSVVTGDAQNLDCKPDISLTMHLLWRVRI